MVAGSIIFSGGCALTYITINKELWMVAATYGFVSAFGQNIALIPTLTTGMKWFPRNKVRNPGHQHSPGHRYGLCCWRLRRRRFGV